VPTALNRSKGMLTLWLEGRVERQAAGSAHQTECRYNRAARSDGDHGPIEQPTGYADQEADKTAASTLTPPETARKSPDFPGRPPAGRKATENTIHAVTGRSRPRRPRAQCRSCRRDRKRRQQRKPEGEPGRPRKGHPHCDPG